MALRVMEASVGDLPERASRGFRVVRDGEPLLFFHWSGDEDPGVSYAQVLRAVPDRLAELGHADETEGILGEVTGMFGVGGEKPKRRAKR